MQRGTRGQIQAILKHLESGKSITNAEAFQLFGCTRLGGQICELRRCGYDISTTIVRKANRYGTTSSYAEYRLNK